MLLAFFRLLVEALGLLLGLLDVLLPIAVIVSLLGGISGVLLVAKCYLRALTECVDLVLGIESGFVVDANLDVDCGPVLRGRIVDWVVIKKRRFGKSRSTPKRRCNWFIAGPIVAVSCVVNSEVRQR